jgi:hypothetical protein
MTKERATFLWTVVAGIRGGEDALCPAIVFHGSVALSFVIPSEAEGSAVSLHL